VTIAEGVVVAEEQIAHDVLALHLRPCLLQVRREEVAFEI
jgi:hypothetical protein